MGLCPRPESAGLGQSLAEVGLQAGDRHDGAIRVRTRAHDCRDMDVVRHLANDLIILSSQAMY